MVDTWKDKLQSHFGCVALVALLQIPGMRMLRARAPRLDLPPTTLTPASNSLRSSGCRSLLEFE
jgi:hypothetical protein